MINRLDLGGTECREDEDTIQISLDGSDSGDEVTPLIIGDYNNMPFPDNAFDEAFGCCYLEQVPDWTELFRVIKSGGQVTVKACNAGYAPPRFIAKHMLAAGFEIVEESHPYEAFPGDFCYDNPWIIKKP